MRKLAFVMPMVLVACGSSPASQTPIAQRTQTSQPASTITVTTSNAIAPTPPLFTGSFDIVSMSDGTKTAVIADVIKQLKVLDGRMTWDIGADRFTIGFWQVGQLEKLAPSDPALYSEFCRASGTVTAHWEGATLVLASTIKAEGSGKVVRVFSKVAGARTDRNVADRSAECSASFAATRITFEVLDKDDRGPTRLRANSEGTIIELARGKPIASIDPRSLLDAH